MANARGIDALFSITKGTTWGTAATIDAALAGFRPLSWDVDEGVEPLWDESYNASPMQRASLLTKSHKPSGSFEMDLKYDGCDLVQAAFFGTSTVGAGPPYLHTITCLSDMTGVFVTLAWTDGLATYTVTSAKITSLTYTISAGAPVKLKATWIGHKYTRAASIGITATTTEPPIDRVQSISTIATFSVAAADGSLAAWSPGLENATVTLSRDYSEPFTTTQAPFRDEMIAGPLTLKGNVTIAPKSAITYPDVVTAGTSYKMKFAHLLTSVTKEHNLWLPQVRLTKTNDGITGKGHIPLPIEFEGQLATAAQAGYPSTLPGLTIWNASAVDPY